MPTWKLNRLVPQRSDFCAIVQRKRVAAPRSTLLFLLPIGCLALLPARSLTQVQRRPLDPPLAAQPESPQHRTRLILKDGTYQIVLSYKVVGSHVRYLSAERGGEAEDIPLALVDLPATKAWQQAHDASKGDGAEGKAAVLSPELEKEEAERAARMPEVATDLHLPEGNSVLVLDTFHGTPELIPLPQTGTELNRETAHDISKRVIQPQSSPHDLFLLKDERADVQLHVPDPVFYVRLDRLDSGEGDSSFIVDTEGRSSTKSPSHGMTSYVLEKVDVRQGARAISSLRLAQLGTGKRQADVVEMKMEALPGGFWEKLTPLEPLEFGEYVLLEILDERSVNADVWDFGVHPTAGENEEALRPEPKRPVQLERRHP